MTLYLAFLAGLAVLRLTELAVSKRNQRRHGDRAEVTAEGVFPWMVALHTAFFFMLPLELWLRRPSLGGPITFIAVIMTILALSLRVWTLRTMGISWNVRVVHGQDYPIVSSGPYRFVRHPNYVVVILELAFVPLIHHLYVSALILTVLNALVLRQRIRNEEAVLRQNPAWVTAMAHKPRFLPFRPPND